MVEKIEREVLCTAYECLLFGEQYKSLWPRGRMCGH